MKTRRPKKSKKGKTIRKRVVLSGGAMSLLEEITENENELSKAFNYINSEKYGTNDFTSSNCAVAMVQDYSNIVNLKKDTVKALEDMQKRMTITRNHLIDLYPNIDQTYGGCQFGGIGFGFEKEKNYQQIMKHIRENPRKAKRPWFDGIAGIHSQITRAFESLYGSDSSNLKDSAAGFYINLTRELEDINHYYLCMVSFLLFLDSKNTDKEYIENGKESFDAQNENLITSVRLLIDEYAKITFMLKSDDHTVDAASKFLTSNKSLGLQYDRISNCKDAIRDAIKEIEQNEKYTYLSKTYLFDGNGNIKSLSVYELTVLDEKRSEIKDNSVQLTIDEINTLTKNKKNFVKVFDDEIKQMKKEVEKERKINHSGEYVKEENSLYMFISDFSNNFTQIYRFTQTENKVEQTDGIFDLIEKVKKEYNNNSEFLIRIMHLLNRLGNHERNGKKIINKDFEKNKNLLEIDGFTNKGYFPNHPFNRYAKTYINGIRQLIDVLIDVHTKYKNKNPNANSLSIEGLYEKIQKLGEGSSFLDKNIQHKRNIQHKSRVLEEYNQYYWSIMNALRRFYDIGKDAGTIEGTVAQNIYSTEIKTDYKKEFTTKLNDIINQKSIIMQNTNLEKILTDMSDNILVNLSFNTFTDFAKSPHGKWRVVDFFEGLKSKTDYNKLVTIWSDSSDMGLAKMDNFLKKKEHTFKSDTTELPVDVININQTFDVTEKKIISIFKNNPGEISNKDENKNYLRNVQNCLLIIDHYATEIKKIVGENDTLGENGNSSEKMEKWKRMHEANAKITKGSPTELQYTWSENIPKYFKNSENKCGILENADIANVSRALSCLKDDFLNEIIKECQADVAKNMNINVVDRLSDENVQKCADVFLLKIADETQNVQDTDQQLSILFRLLTLATEEKLQNALIENNAEKILNILHPPEKGGGIFDNVKRSIVGQKQTIFNIRTAYDNIFEQGNPKTLNILVSKLIAQQKIGKVIEILGTPNYNETAIGKIKAVVQNEKLETGLNSALDNNVTARSFYTSATSTEEAKKKADEADAKAKKEAADKSKKQEVEKYEKKAISDVETDFRDRIRDFVETDESDAETQMIIIHEMYDDLASSTEMKGNRKLLKNVVNNLIDFTESVYLRKSVENKLEKEKWPDAFLRRNQLIDQFTRLNTKPNVDPFLERVISTFWPEADATKYKRPKPEIISKETLIETRLYPTLPTVKFGADKDENTDVEKDNKTYGSKIMTLTEKVHGDQSDYDALGVEMFLNTLLTTGSNVSFVPPIAYTESYLIEEKLDNRPYINNDY